MSDNPSILGDADPGWDLCSPAAPGKEAIRFHPSWRTSTVVALAEGIVWDGSFDVMPILADALQDTGCDNEVLLDHCRYGVKHTKACWALQLVLSPNPPAVEQPQPATSRPILVEAAHMVDDLWDRNALLVAAMIFVGIGVFWVADYTSPAFRAFLDTPANWYVAWAVIPIGGGGLMALYLFYCVKLLRNCRRRQRAGRYPR